jgi:hypothetical protein
MIELRPLGPEKDSSEVVHNKTYRTENGQSAKCLGDMQQNSASACTASPRSKDVKVLSLVIIAVVVLCHVPLGIASAVSSDDTIEESKKIISSSTFEDDSPNQSDLELQELIEEEIIPTSKNRIGFPARLEDPQHFTHQWAAHIIGGNEEADRIARKHGFINGGEVRAHFYFAQSPFVLLISVLSFAHWAMFYVKFALCFALISGSVL